MKLLTLDVLVDQALVELVTQALNKFIHLFLRDKADTPIDFSRDRFTYDLLPDFRIVYSSRSSPQSWDQELTSAFPSWALVRQWEKNLDLGAEARIYLCKKTIPGFQATDISLFTEPKYGRPGEYVNIETSNINHHQEMITREGKRRHFMGLYTSFQFLICT